MAKELTVRERRKIYEDVISVIAQAHKMKALTDTKSFQTLLKKQMNKCTNIVATSLGYKEVVYENNTMMVPIDGDETYAMSKAHFEELVQQLPTDKEVRETLWKTLVKKDKKATEIFKTL